jgi:hypothetical protein
MIMALVQRQHVRHMNVPAHDNIGAGCGPAAHGGFSAVQQVVTILATYHSYRLMHHYDTQLPWRRSLEQVDYPFRLRERHLAILMPVGTRSIHTDDKPSFRCIHRFQIGAAYALVVSKGRKQADQNIKQRNIMVARYHQHRDAAQPLKERARDIKLLARGSLSDVTRNDYDFGRLLMNQAYQCFDDSRPFGAKMRIGDLHQ